MQTLPRALVASPPHAVLPLGVQMQLRRAALDRDISAIDRITDALVQAGLYRPRSECAWMTRAEIARAVTSKASINAFCAAFRPTEVSIIDSTALLKSSCSMVALLWRLVCGSPSVQPQAGRPPISPGCLPRAAGAPVALASFSSLGVRGFVAWLADAGQATLFGWGVTHVNSMRPQGVGRQWVAQAPSILRVNQCEGLHASAG